MGGKPLRGHSTVYWVFVLLLVVWLAESYYNFGTCSERSLGGFESGEIRVFFPVRLAFVVAQKSIFDRFWVGESCR